MRYKLRVLKGTLKNRRGQSAGLEINIRNTRFLLGSAADCQMCCRSQRISPHHCELTVSEGRLYVCDLGSETGTFVNDQRTEGATELSIGDSLRVGRLEFEIVGAGEAETRDQADPMSEFVSEFLGQADDEDRERRMRDPLSRKFAVQTDDTEMQLTSEEVDQADEQKPVRPPKKPPAKLPPAPDYVADDSMQAAEETLEKIYEQNKLKKQKTRRFI